MPTAPRRQRFQKPNRSQAGGGSIRVRFVVIEFPSGGKALAGDTARAATSDEVKELRREASALKEVVAELTLENRLVRKSAIGAGEDDA